MKLSAFLDIMEMIAPKALAWEKDNPGLLIGTDRAEIKKVFLALDCTSVTAKEAIDWGADLMLTHHPLFWTPVRRILPDDPQTASAYLLLRNGIALFSAHTNLDAAQGGVNDQLASLFGVSDAKPLLPEGLGRVGTLPKPLSLCAFAQQAERVLQGSIRCCGDAESLVSRIAFIGGAGGGELDAVLASGADTLVTGEIKHDQALWAQAAGLQVLQAGHYETERIVLYPLLNHLQSLTDDVQYNVTRFETSCLRELSAPLGT